MSVDHKPIQNHMAIADNGASGTYLTPLAPHLFDTKSTATIHVGLPNGQTLQTSTACQLNFDMLPEEA